MRQLLSSVEFSLSTDTAVIAMVSVRNELQERVLACRKIDDEEVQVALLRETQQLAAEFEREQEQMRAERGRTCAAKRLQKLPSAPAPPRRQCFDELGRAHVTPRQ